MKKRLDIEEYAQGILKGNQSFLSKALSLTESSLDSDEELLADLMEKLLPFTGKSIRIGISGLPGSGKSTLINLTGEKYIKEGKKVAVLAIDPSSPSYKGSILGDKVRMEGLFRHENAFIRPTPSKNALGGLALKTREALLLCEAAGYDVVIIETVGVGQSESIAYHLVDLFVLVLLTGAGDEIQAIKRGVIELADILLINKAENENLIKAEALKDELNSVIESVIDKRKSEGFPKVITGSSLSEEGISSFLSIVDDFFIKTGKEKIIKKRENQFSFWMKEILKHKVWHEVENKLDKNSKWLNMERDVKEGKISLYKVSQVIISDLFKS